MLTNHHLGSSLLLFLSPLLAAQDIDQGYGSAMHVLPAGSSNVLSLPDLDARVYFDGMSLLLDDGSTSRSLLDFPSLTFGSFTIRIDADRLLFGESSSGGLWLVPIAAGASPQRIAELSFNFDAAIFDAQTALVSAKTGGFSASDNDVFAVDLGTGSTDLIAQIPGASGPLTVDEDKSLVYATSSNLFPAPPGSVDILRFSADQVLSAIGPDHLGAADGEVLVTGLDAAGDLAFDGDGDLFVIDWMNSNLVEISMNEAGILGTGALISYGFAGGPTASGLQYIPGPRRPASRFEPFQPAGRGGSLHVHESEFGGASLIREMSPARASMAVTPAGGPISAGPFAMHVKGGPSNGSAIVAVGFDFFDFEIPLLLPSFEQPLFWQAGLFVPFFTREITLDVNGESQLDLVHPGFFFPLRLSTQCVFLSEDGTVAGTSSAADFLLW
ncbi:MAG: hypothetical protein ACYTG5_22785 [Planctomycetota bacterium]|jgi:hypothetical protein